MNWFYLKENLLLFPGETEDESEEFIFRSCFDFDSATRAAGYFINYDYDAKEINSKRFLFSEENCITKEKFDFANGVIVMGTHQFYDPDDDDEYIDSITWAICNSLEEISEFLKKEEIVMELPIFYFNVKDDCLKTEVDKYNKLCEEAENYKMRTVHFEGDIIITDPCYIMRSENHGTKPITENDWDFCDYGDEMEVFGFTNYLTHNTLYGDWSCSTYNSDTKEKIGEFCADAGLVSVFLLDEVLRYNPDFNYHIERPFTTTWIKDFNGDIHFEKLDECTLIVKGIGNINFETRQTGF